MKVACASADVLSRGVNELRSIVVQVIENLPVELNIPIAVENNVVGGPQTVRWLEHM